MNGLAWVRVSCVVVLAAGCASGRTFSDAGVPPDSPRDSGAPPIDAGRDAGSSVACDGVDCSALDGPCVVGTCDPADGSCEGVAMPDATACDDGDACTTGDACGGGVCAGAAVDCSALDSACEMGACAADGSCVAMPVADGTSCDDGSPCTSADVCGSGSCAGAAIDCSALSDSCNTGVCDPSGGGCIRAAVVDGTSCDDGDRCTSADRCTSGSCNGTTVDCSATGDACNAGMCDPSSGGCVTVPSSGGGCDDGDACTSGDVCTAGACAGAPIAGCGGGVLVPGRTDLIAGQGGWSVRCLAWSGRTCTRLQGRMDCSVCTIYASCGVWHDITDFNDSDNRSSVNWCALATGNATILSKGSGGTAVAPRGCGWGSTTHPHCESARATFHVPVVGVPTAHGALLHESYCSASTRLLNLNCAGW